MAAALSRSQMERAAQQNIILGVSIMKRAVIYVRTSSEHQGRRPARTNKKQIAVVGGEQGIEM